MGQQNPVAGRARLARGGMAAFLYPPLFRHKAQTVRLVVAGDVIVGVLAFLLYYIL